MILHSTYFNLKESNSSDVVNAYMEEAREYLSKSKGMISFQIGKRDTSIESEFNDTEFDVAMHQIFQDLESYASYRKDDNPQHNQFIKDANFWVPSATRRVIDVDIDQLLIGGNSSLGQKVGEDGNMPTQVIHDVYFKLIDSKDDTIIEFIKLCKEKLPFHEGIQVFSIGKKSNVNRDVTFQCYDVSLYLQFESEQSYNSYLKSEEHKEFESKMKCLVEKIIVFDSLTKYHCNVHSL